MASPRICICEECHKDYGACNLFARYDIDERELREIPLRSHDNIPFEAIGEEKDDGFIQPNSYVALRADNSTDHGDMIWLVKVADINKMNNMKSEEDSYHNVIPKGTLFFSGHFLERLNVEKRSTTYKLVDNKITYFYKESVIFPFVNIVESKKGLVLSDEDYTDILIYIEQQGLVHV